MREYEGIDGKTLHILNLGTRHRWKTLRWTSENMFGYGDEQNSPDPSREYNFGHLLVASLFDDELL
jgi:hypothetical protein